jgi:hypothetical protein
MLSGKPVHLQGLDACLSVAGIEIQRLDQLTLNP